MNTLETLSIFPAEALQKAAHMVEILRTHDDYIISAHAGADGDAAGSTAAMGYVLKALHKRFILYNATGSPSYLDWLPQPTTLYTHLSPLPFTPRVAIILDCGDVHRVGSELASLLFPTGALPCLNIDHHYGNPCFGTLGNWVEPTYAATAQLVAYMARAAEIPLIGPLAENIGLALLTDTGGFAHGNTSPHVLALAAHMAALGLDFSRLREQLNNQWAPKRMQLWGRLMQEISLIREGTVACTAVPYTLFQTTATSKEDLEGFVEMMRRLKGVKITVLVREDIPGLCKFSLRSFGTVNVRAVAAALGGGGHINAAGGTLHMTLSQAKATILTAVCAELDAEQL